jgi:PPOX class probable F420-dependent enzyme
MTKQQRRGRSIAMSEEELHEFLTTERLCRVATVGADGGPHNSPLWFVWDGEALWLNTLVKSQRWTNFRRDPRVSVLVDGGDGYFELRGVELLGCVEEVGGAPRTGERDSALDAPERLFGDKYSNGAFVADGKHAWVRLVPDKIVSWDFRKISPSG